MMNSIVFVLLLFISEFCLGLEYNKQQRYNTNTDFLLHEAGGNTAQAQKHNTAYSSTTNLQNTQNQSGKRDYVAQFPPLRAPPSTPTSQTTAKLTSVTPSPSSTTQKLASSKRDYVAPNLPSSSFPSTPTTHKPSLITQPATGKRDYVAPQFPTQKPPGKVKDLINFYDTKNKDQNSPQKVPSYSSILQGNKHSTSVGTTVTAKPTTLSTPSNTPKPISFSSVVAGSSKPGSQTTSKPSTQGPSSTPAKPNVPLVLPSSILNNNKNNGNSPSETELQTLSEELLRKDINNAAKYITVNYQEKTTTQSSEDKAPQPLLSVVPTVWNIPTVQKFVPLLDNYERDTLINEYVTPQERNEENAFLDAIMSTTVIRHLMNFLKDKGYVTPDPRQQRDFLKQLWFSLYSRGKGKISSSGFEHVFLSELKQGDIIGLHNWIYFLREESANRANYLGYLKYTPIGDKGVVMKLHFNQQGVEKPVNSMFIGTSPELEIALYTLCFVARADNDCKLKLGNKDVNIVTHTFRYRSKNLIGSAYPQI